MSGELWESDGVLTAVNYSSPAEQNLRDSLIKAEFSALHPSLQGDWVPVDRMELEDEQFGLARIDKSIVSDTLYRLSLFATNAKLDDKPLVCLDGCLQLEGNMGEGYYYFKSQDTVASYSFGILNEDCVPATGGRNFSWMGKDIPCNDHYYQIEAD